MYHVTLVVGTLWAMDIICQNAHTLGFFRNDGHR